MSDHCANRVMLTTTLGQMIVIALSALSSLKMSNNAGGGIDWKIFGMVRRNKDINEFVQETFSSVMGELMKYDCLAYICKSNSENNSNG